MNTFLYPPAGHQDRSAMGEYTGDPPLTSLAIPTPGPLDYAPKPLKSGIQYSIIGKPSTKIEEKSHIGPGPMKYDVRPVKAGFENAPEWSFGHRFETKLVLEDTSSIPFGSEMRLDFGREARAATISGWFKLYGEKTPGPDSYLPQAEFGPKGTAPKYTFGGKSTHTELPTPGPLDYDVPKSFRKIKNGPSYTIGSRPKESTFLREEKEFSPGPNAYIPKLQASEKAASLKGQHKEFTPLNTPGPANYIMPSSLFSGPQYSLTARNIPYQVGSAEDDYVVIQPGPADYIPKCDLTKSKAPAASLGARNKPEKNPGEFVPGPGAYQPKDRQIMGNDAPKVTLKGRHRQKTEPTPGPGYYDSHIAEEKLKPTHVVRMGSKNNIGIFQEPHPTERFKSMIEITPGPSDYSVKKINATKPAGPAYSLRKRLDETKRDEIPGPNVYHSLPNFITPKTTIKSRASPYVLVFPSERVDTLRV